MHEAAGNPVGKIRAMQVDKQDLPFADDVLAEDTFKMLSAFPGIEPI